MTATSAVNQSLGPPAAHGTGSFGTETLAVKGCEGRTPATVPRSALHDPAEPWSPTNCYVDVWIGLLAALGLNPVPMLSAALSADFLGDQWEFVKPRTEDLEVLYGIKVGEYDTWRPLGEHLQLTMSRGDALIVEVDAYYLPDTEGVSYRTEHTKTSIVPLRLDPLAGELVYLHNDGAHTLAGEDLDETLGPRMRCGRVPYPYVELVRLHTLNRRSPEDLWHATLAVARDHLRRASAPGPDGHGPADGLVAAIREHLPRLAERGMGHFHLYSFATTRQAGLTAALAAHLCRYLADGAAAWPNGVSVEELARAADSFDRAAAAAKTLQFQLARVASGRTARIDKAAEALAAGYRAAIHDARAALDLEE